MQNDKDCNCNEKGFRQLNPYNSWNYKCTIGLFYVLLIIGFLITAVKTVSDKSYMYYAFGLLVLIIVITALQPIVLLYIPSAILTATEFTPEFLPFDKYFPRHVYFEQPDTFYSIKQEVTQMLFKTHGGKDLTLTRDTYSGANRGIGKDVKVVNNTTVGWRILNIKAGDTYSPYADSFPTLRKVLEQCPEVISCAISVLEPGVEIPIHVGYYKGVMRYMLPTHVPAESDKVFLCVNGKKYNWTEGEGVLWDDNFPHKVYNYTKEIRVVVYMDIKRPLTGIIDWINRKGISMAANSSIVKKEVKRTERQIKLT